MFYAKSLKDFSYFICSLILLFFDYLFTLPARHGLPLSVWDYMSWFVWSCIVFFLDYHWILHITQLYVHVKRSKIKKCFLCKDHIVSGLKLLCEFGFSAYYRLSLQLLESLLINYQLEEGEVATGTKRRQAREVGEVDTEGEVGTTKNIYAHGRILYV